jgi:hypothetical protein
MNTSFFITFFSLISFYVFPIQGDKQTKYFKFLCLAYRPVEPRIFLRLFMNSRWLLPLSVNHNPSMMADGVMFLFLIWTLTVQLITFIIYLPYFDYIAYFRKSWLLCLLHFIQVMCAACANYALQMQISLQHVLFSDFMSLWRLISSLFFLALFKLAHFFSFIQVVSKSYCTTDASQIIYLTLHWQHDALQAESRSTDMFDEFEFSGLWGLHIQFFSCQKVLVLLVVLGWMSSLWFTR